MINLPETTNVYRQMPKELFYKYLNDDITLKKTFIDEIESIIWINTLSMDTLSIKRGTQLSAIAIVEIVLKRQAINPNIIEIINKETEQFTIFIMRYEEWGQLWCRELRTLNTRTGFVNSQNYFQSNWMLIDDLTLTVEGWNFDQVYEGFVSQIIGKPFRFEIDRNNNYRTGESLIDSQTNENEELKILENYIKTIKEQMQNELQFSKQFELASDLKIANAKIARIKRTTLTEIPQPVISESQQESVANMRSFFPNVFLKLQDGTGTRFSYTLL